MKNRMRQQGVTLIELMIAMLVSLVLAAGVGTVYLSSKRNYQARDQLSMMNENARVALETLQQHLEHAGYATAAKLPIGNYFYVNGDADPLAGMCGTLGTSSLAGVKASATRDRDGSTQYGDMISVRFIGDASLFEDALGNDLDAACYGGAVAMKDALIYNAFNIATDTDVKDSTGTLIPILYAVGSNANQFKQPVVNGIQNMQFMYGIDGNLDGTADYFLNATNTTTDGLWQRVVSIKVALLVKSLEPILDKDMAQSYNLLGVTFSPTDRYQRRVYTTVIQLRNVVDG